MATTTNYGWTTPDDTALVKDGASAIRSLGTSVDTTTKNLNPSTTLGDIEYRSSTANTNTRLGIGSTGNVLTVSGGVPVWSAPAGGGKVLQVVFTEYTTPTTVAAQTLTDIGLSLAITPSSATSKILVLWGVRYRFDKSGTSDTWTKLGLLRGATQIWGGTGLFGIRELNNAEQGVYMSGSYLDTPATTSSTTYKIQGARNGASGTLSYQEGNTGSTLTLLEIGA
jgi:hypothetical protein